MMAGASRGAEPKSRRCNGPGATDGQHGRCRAKGCPQIGSQHMRQGYTHPLQGLLRRRLWPERATRHFVSARVLIRCHCAATSDSLRCDARSTQHAAGTRAPPQNTRRAHRMRILDARRRLASRNGAGVVGVASKHSESSRPRPRPRSREPGTTPPPSGFLLYDGEGGAPRGRASHGLTEGRRSLRPRVRRSSGGAPVSPCHRGEASLWSPLGEERSNGRVPSSLKTQLEMRDAPAARTPDFH